MSAARKPRDAWGPGARAIGKQALDMIRTGLYDVEEHGQITIGFARVRTVGGETVGATDEDRAEFRAKLQALCRPRRKYTHRITPLSMERDGERVLAEDDHNPIAHGACAWFVRIYYVSQGDELLCFDAGPFVRQTADRAKSEASHYEPGPKWDEQSKSWSKSEWSCPQPEVWHATREAETISARTAAIGARLVVLPSARVLLQRAYEESVRKDPTLARATPDDDFDHTVGLDEGDE